MSSDNPNYIETPNYIEINIFKPLYGTFCYIRDAWVRKSQSTGKPLKIKIPQGEAIMTATQWLDGAKMIEKVFKIANQPMKLYGNYVKVPNLETPDKLTPKPTRSLKRLLNKGYVLTDNKQAIQCLKCMYISHNPNDVKFKYCGNCHKFHENKSLN